MPGKKAKVSAVSVEETTAAPAVKDVAASPAVSTVPATGPAASLSSVEQVAEYQFDPNRYASHDLKKTVAGGLWKLSNRSIPEEFGLQWKLRRRARR